MFERTNPIQPGWIAAVVLSLAAPVSAEGFRSPTTGAQGLGASGARFAFIDDASAAWHNPANLTLLEGWEASFEPTLVHHRVSYEAGPVQVRTENPWKFLPALFVGGPLNDRVSAGLGVTVPYGLSIEWDLENAGALKYATPHYVDLQTLNLNPNLAFKLGDRVSLAVGVDVMWGQLDLRQHAFYGPLFGTGELRALGDGLGVSGNAALSVEPFDGHRIAFTARMPMSVEFEGHFTAGNAPAVLPVTRSEFESRIKFPTVLGLGYGVRVTETIRVEANAEWIQFSRFDALPLEVNPVMAATLGLPSAVAQNWKDTFTFGVGGDWAFAESWKLRLSYQHYQTPVPDSTFSMTIPDSDQNVVTAGIGYRKGRHRVDLSYSRVFYEGRSISAAVNPLYAGRYEIDVHLVSLGYGYRF